MKKRKVGILLFDYVDVLDFTGPAEVFSLTTNNKAEKTLTLYKKHLLPMRPFEVCTISETGMELKTHSEIIINPDFSIDNSPALDILIIPGGPLRAVQSMAKNQKIQDWIIKHKSIEYISSVCTGAYILGGTGLLDGKKATTHHLALKLFEEKYPEIQVLSDRKVVHDGNIITYGGVSSGINMALYIVKQILGKSTAERTAKTIEFTM
ncbi:DJ-1/PfpI family protein [Sediminibacillus dalangtanensis]|uniref:DJ-1/PfpI family protein n=1 Tax=Sediminibacillus dalangtanensis TaxID=2729421 RepID=A0ABX7VZ54_9BACI|nr:DJ-1/PfpI family protein [Sediminibacillus dalangtanensis]QTN01141.1 DJ-1/PfpI family protein [Sediminibacillus dalangtanensis]